MTKIRASSRAAERSECARGLWGVWHENTRRPLALTHCSLTQNPRASALVPQGQWEPTSRLFDFVTSEQRGIHGELGFTKRDRNSVYTCGFIPVLFVSQFVLVVCLWRRSNLFSWILSKILVRVNIVVQQSNNCVSLLQSSGERVVKSIEEVATFLQDDALSIAAKVGGTISCCEYLVLCKNVRDIWY